MNSKLLPLLALAMSLPCAAEVIDGPANIRAVPNGRMLFSLENGIQVQHREASSDWFHIGVLVHVDAKSGFADEAMTIVKKGVALYDERGRRIGVAFEQFETEPYFDEEIHEGQKIAFLRGYTHRQNIQPDSILEAHLARHLSTGNSLTLKELDDHLRDFQYQEGFAGEGFASYIQFDNPTDDPSPWPRALLYFYEGRLIAVYHGRPVLSNRIAASTTIRNDTMSYVIGVPTELRERFSAIYYPIIEGAD